MCSSSFIGKVVRQALTWLQKNSFKYIFLGNCVDFYLDLLIFFFLFFFEISRTPCSRNIFKWLLLCFSPFLHVLEYPHESLSFSNILPKFYPHSSEEGIISPFSNHPLPLLPLPPFFKIAPCPPRYWWNEGGGGVEVKFWTFEREGKGATKIKQVWTRGEGGSKYRALCDNVITECPLL